MALSKGIEFYYIAYGYEDDRQWENYVEDGNGGFCANRFYDFDKALKAAKASHKAEIEYQQDEYGYVGDDVMNTYVMVRHTRYSDYELAMISGRRSKVKFFEYEDDDDE